MLEFKLGCYNSNTQKDLTINGYTKPTLARLCRICEGSGVYLLKSNKE